MSPAPEPPLMHRLVALLATGLILLPACAVGSSDQAAGSAPTSTTAQPVPEAATSTTEPPAPRTEPSPLAERIVPLGSAIYDPATANPERPPRPTVLSIPAIGVSEVSIVDVGVLDNGEMEIPGRTEVGWYRYGPRPGEPGSAVLAAHIAFDGRAGVFRRLAAIEPGATVTVGFEDGSTGIYRVFETAQYPKDQLPNERVFSREGDPVLTLITCGGDFNRSLRSYADNVVAYAIPLSSLD